jgi:hypothetical protein
MPDFALEPIQYVQSIEYPLPQEVKSSMIDRYDVIRERFWKIKLKLSALTATCNDPLMQPYEQSYDSDFILCIAKEEYQKQSNSRLWVIKLTIPHRS